MTSSPPSPSVDPVRERIEQLGEIIGDSLQGIREVQDARNHLTAALTAVLDLAGRAESKLRAERAAAERERTVAARNYAQGVADGVGIAVDEFVSAITAGLGVTP